MLYNIPYPILQNSYMTGYVFSKHCYIVFTDTICSFPYYITNQNYEQNVLYMTTLLLCQCIYINNTYITCYISCYITYDIEVHSYLPPYILLDHGCVVFTDTYTICNITRYITIYIVDWYSNITKDITKQIGYITFNIPEVHIIHIH